MRKFSQKLILAAVILSCGFIYSLGSSASAPALKQAQRHQSRLSEKLHGARAPYRVVVYYAQDRHAPW